MTRHLTDEEISLLAEVDAQDDTVDQLLMEHLQQCSDCHDELVLARMIDRKLAEAPRMTAPPELLISVMGAIETAKVHQRRAVALLASMAAAMLVFMAWWLASGGAAMVVLDALDLARTARVVASVTSAVVESLSIELIVTSALLLLGSSAALGRLMTRVNRGPDATAPAG